LEFVKLTHPRRHRHLGQVLQHLAVLLGGGRDGAHIRGDAALALAAAPVADVAVEHLGQPIAKGIERLSNVCEPDQLRHVTLRDLRFYMITSLCSSMRC